VLQAGGIQVLEYLLPASRLEVIVKYTEAFAEYGAILVNPVWSYSAIAEDGSLVLSCWGHRFRFDPGGALRYEDEFSRWSTNHPGKSLLQKHLKQAFEGDLPVRLVLAIVKDTNSIDAGKPASKVPKTIDVRKDLIGRVTELTSERFAVDF
jgi:hypothetical protein